MVVKAFVRLLVHARLTWLVASAAAAGEAGSFGDTELLPGFRLDWLLRLACVEVPPPVLANQRGCVSAAASSAKSARICGHGISSIRNVRPSIWTHVLKTRGPRKGAGR